MLAVFVPGFYKTHSTQWTSDSKDPAAFRYPWHLVASIQSIEIDCCTQHHKIHHMVPDSAGGKFKSRILHLLGKNMVFCKTYLKPMNWHPPGTNPESYGLMVNHQSNKTPCVKSHPSIIFVRSQLLFIYFMFSRWDEIQRVLLSFHPYPPLFGSDYAADEPESSASTWCKR